MTTRVPMLLALMAISLLLGGCGGHRSYVYLWPPAADVNDP